MPREHLHCITGRLAAEPLRRVLADLAREVGFDYSVEVLPITVAALMTPDWIGRHWQVPPAATQVLLPGYCGGDLAGLQSQVRIPVERGPRDLNQLPLHFSRGIARQDYGAYDIELLAEINHGPRLSRDEILDLADLYVQSGADIVDLGCEPGHTWAEVGDVVAALRDRGYRVSIDSMNPREVARAAHAGAELALSVNSSNRTAAVDWGIEVVAIPDDPHTLAGLEQTIHHLSAQGIPLRIDPILEPIGFGFASSLGRYLETQRRFPDAHLLMGIGNLTELTDCDSAGINTLLIAFCQELGIRSVLTTQVIPWARTSVKECDLARRLMFYALTHGVLPKHLEPGLVMLRDAAPVNRPAADLAQLARSIRDRNLRIYVAEGELHLVAHGLHLHQRDPFSLMEQLQASAAGLNLDPAHAFYLGYELAKARIALTLGKNYVQDEALDWGLATEIEQRHYFPHQKRRPFPEQ